MSDTPDRASLLTGIQKQIDALEAVQHRSPALQHRLQLFYDLRAYLSKREGETP